MRIAIVDDNEEMLEMYESFLSSHYNVTIYSNPTVALKEIVKKNFDIVILDWRMPHIYGGELLNLIRLEKTGGNYIFHTNNIDPDVESQMMSMNVQDILMKDNDLNTTLKRIHYRIKVILASKNSHWSGVDFNDDLRNIEIRNIKIKLTDIEYRLFRYIVSFDTEVATREQIAQNVWGEEVSNESMDFQISSIRKKLGIYSGLLKTKKNVGFYLDSMIWEAGEL